VAVALCLALVGKCSFPLHPNMSVSSSVVFEKHYKEWSLTDAHTAIQYASPNQTRLGRRADQVFALLRVLCDFLEKEHIEHWVDWGTLLGAVRGGDVISWDDDGDVAIRDRSYAQLFTAAARFKDSSQQCPSCRLVVRYLRPSHLPYGHPHDIPFMLINVTSGVYVDVFMYSDISLMDEISNRHKDTHCHFSIQRRYVFPVKKNCRLRQTSFFLS